jgi:hypothetical protein
MPANGQEIVADSKSTSAPLVEAKSARTDPHTKTAVNVSATGTSRQRRCRRNPQEIPAANGEERFFLSTGDCDGGVPAIGRECPTEADAVIEAFRAKLTFYRVSEFQTRAEIGPSGEPILRKEVLKRPNPAS